MTTPTAEIESLLGYLTPVEKEEVNHYTVLLSTGQPHVEYQRDPIRWAHDKLAIDPRTLLWSLNPGYKSHHWDGTPDPLAAAFQGIVDWRDVAIESGTGTGKSYGVAILILWFLACFENSECYTFALNEDQLKLYIWKNITELWPRFQPHFPNAQLSSLTIRMKGGIDETWSAHGRPVQIKAGETVATRAAGMHAEHMLLVYEEMAGMDKAVPAAGKNTCTAPHNLRIGIGNPNSQLDTLHRMSQEPGVLAVRMSALDHPNVVTGNANLVPGAVSQVSIDKRVQEYGTEDPIYQSRVRGLSPEQASNALIRMEWLKRSAARYEQKKVTGTLPRRITGKGVDVANSEHGDRACIADFADNALVRLAAFQCPDANALGRQVALEMDQTSLTPIRCGVDTIGVGAGTFNELGRLRKRVVPMVASQKPVQRTEKAPDGGLYEWIADGNRFRHARDQWHWQIREDLRCDRLDIERDSELWEELLILTFEDEPLTIVMAKDDVRTLLGRSPDKSDAVVMGNWVRERKGPNWGDAPTDRPHADWNVALRTKDGKPPVWIGPEGHTEQDRGGYAEEYPVNF